MAIKKMFRDYPEFSWLSTEFDENHNGIKAIDFAGFKEKVYWRCSKGHSYRNSIENRIKGIGCPYCSNKKVLEGYNDLQTVNPIIASEWDYAKNGSLLPTMVTQGSNKKVWWLCDKGHDYEATIVDRTTRGNGCPYCTGRRVLRGFNDLATTHPSLVAEWDFEKNGNLTPYNVSKGKNKAVWWKCKNGHEWRATVNSRTNMKSGCPICTNQRVLAGFNDLASKYPNICKEWDYVKNQPLRPDQVTSNTHKKVWWLCPKYKHSYVATIANRISLGNGCPYCAGQRVLKGFNDLETTRPQLASEWDYEKNGTITPEMFTTFSTAKVWWKCRDYDHSYQMPIYYRTNTGCGCPYCAGKKVLKGFNDLQTVNPHVASQWDYEKNGTITPEMVSRSSTKKFWWKCEFGHSWQVDVDHRTRGHECPYCSGSRAERLGYALLRKWKVYFKGEYRFNDLYMIRDLPYDIYCEEYKLLVEFDGIQHFQSIAYFMQKTSMKERIRKDNIKTEYAFKHMKPLLRIPYVYDAEKDKEKIAQLLKDFIRTRKIPQEIIDFYQQFEFSNYAKLASEWNAKHK